MQNKNVPFQDFAEPMPNFPEFSYAYMQDTPSQHAAYPPSTPSASDFAARDLEDLAYGDISIKKPKKTFQSKEEQTRYVDGFRTKYKTEMCKNWELTGLCAFQESCSFAHGPEELN